MINMKRVIAGAALAVGLGAVASRSQASLQIDLVPNAAGSTGVTVVDATHVQLTDPNAVLKFDVFVRVKGSNASTTDESFTFLQGGFSTPGGLKGDLEATLSPDFATGAASPGTPADSDGDGDMDIIGPSTGSTAGWWYPRAGSAITGTDFNVGTLTFKAKGNLSGNTGINFITRVASGTGTWKVDNVTKLGINATPTGDTLIVPAIQVLGQTVVGNRKAKVTVPPGDGTNLATGGAVEVTGSNGKYVSEVDPLTANGQAGNVVIHGIEVGGLLYVMTGLAGDPAAISAALADPALTQDGAQVLTSGPEFDALKVHYPFMNALFKFTNAPAGDKAFSFDFGDGVQLDNVAAVPEPTALGIFAAAGLGLLARRRRTA